MALFGKTSIDPLWDAFVDIEHEFILAVGRLLENESLLNLWTSSPFQAQQELRRELDKIANSNFNRTIRADLKRAFEINAKRALDSDESFFEYALNQGALVRRPIPISESSTLERILQDGYMSVERALDTASSIAKATTITRVNQAALAVAGGRVGIDVAIRAAANELAAEGIHGMVYPSGATIGLPEYVRREIVTQVMNTTRQLSWERALEWGSELIQISVHAGARPGCEPYAGGVFSITGESDKWPSLERDTTYGEPDGIFGINCRHFSWPWFEGLNEEILPAEKERLSSSHGMDNERIFELSQEQRYNERQIRAWKRRAAIQEKAGLDPGKATQKIKYWQKRQRDFIDDYSMFRRDYQREAA